jgi:hypothetical protein
MQPSNIGHIFPINKHNLFKFPYLPELNRRIEGSCKRMPPSRRSTEHLNSPYSRTPVTPNGSKLPNVGEIITALVDDR